MLSFIIPKKSAFLTDNWQELRLRQSKRDLYHMLRKSSSRLVKCTLPFFLAQIHGSRKTRQSHILNSDRWHLPRMKRNPRSKSICWMSLASNFPHGYSFQRPFCWSCLWVKEYFAQKEQASVIVQKGMMKIKTSQITLQHYWKRAYLSTCWRCHDHTKQKKCPQI